MTNERVMRIGHLSVILLLSLLSLKSYTNNSYIYILTCNCPRTHPKYTANDLTLLTCSTYVRDVTSSMHTIHLYVGMCQQMHIAPWWSLVQQKRTRTAKNRKHSNFSFAWKVQDPKKCLDPPETTPGPKEGSSTTRSTQATSLRMACGRHGCLHSLFWMERHMASPYPANTNTIWENQKKSR